MSVLESDIKKKPKKQQTTLKSLPDFLMSFLMQLLGKAGRSSEDLFCINSVFHRKLKNLVLGRSLVQMITLVYFRLSG